jgi:prolyl oligopeptidase
MRTLSHVRLGGPRPRPALPANLIRRQIDFEHHEDFVEQGDAGRVKLDIPTDTHLSLERDWLILNLRSAWRIGSRLYPAGALLVTSLHEFLAGEREFTVLFEPSPRSLLQNFSSVGDVIALEILDNVRSRILFARFSDGTWTVEPIFGFSELSTLDISPLAADDDEWFSEAERERGVSVVASQNSLTPPTQSLVRFGESPEPLKHSPKRFSAAGLTIPSMRRGRQTERGFRIFKSVARSCAPTLRTPSC